MGPGTGLGAQGLGHRPEAHSARWSARSAAVVSWFSAARPVASRAAQALTCQVGGHLLALSCVRRAPRPVLQLPPGVRLSLSRV